MRQAFEFHLPDIQFVSTYILSPVSCSRRRVGQYAHKNLKVHTATVVWLKSVPWLVLVLWGSVLWELVLWELVRESCPVGVDSCELVRGSGLVGVGLVGIDLRELDRESWWESARS